MEKQNDFIGDLIIRDCKIDYRNLSGTKNEYNPNGARKFCVILDDEAVVNRMKGDGWNIKPYKPNRENHAPEWKLEVEARWRNREGEPLPKRLQPRIYILGRKKTELGEEDVDQIDGANIDKVSLTIRPRLWEMRGQSGIKAFVKNMYVYVTLDELDAEFENWGEDDNELPFDD